MRVAKELVLKYLESRGQGGDATGAAAALPETVDTSADRELLQQMGVDPLELEGTFQGAEPDL